MSAKPSALTLMFRMFCTVAFMLFVISVFWNVVSGFNMFPLVVVLISAAVITILFVIVGGIFTNIAGEVVYGNNSKYKKWKDDGGRPFWDSLAWPINAASRIERQTGLAEPKYTDFTPPQNWMYQCPSCGARVEHQYDVCWNCNYGADGDNSEYVKRWGVPPERPLDCSDGSCRVPVAPIKKPPLGSSPVK